MLFNGRCISPQSPSIPFNTSLLHAKKYINEETDLRCSNCVFFLTDINIPDSYTKRQNETLTLYIPSKCSKVRHAITSAIWPRAVHPKCSQVTCEHFFSFKTPSFNPLYSDGFSHTNAYNKDGLVQH